MELMNGVRTKTLLNHTDSYCMCRSRHPFVSNQCHQTELINKRQYCILFVKYMLVLSQRRYGKLYYRQKKKREFFFGCFPELGFLQLGRIFPERLTHSYSPKTSDVIFWGLRKLNLSEGCRIGMGRKLP